MRDVAKALMQANPMWTAEEVSSLFRVDRRTVMAWALKNKLPLIKISKQRLFREADIMALLQNGMSSDGEVS